ncbi:hypothetical protein HII36_08690 [Nonomuraea sp. NN258]|uniref:hypothetical protein n=1 Tax=Nonomuraea antri TaxID=2730852 RepID=UPI00156851E9|nr:hypothetical protein [Nonomuraea antri]NRQ31915.1 hypothetical protein [Nonomuraea antri]
MNPAVWVLMPIAGLGCVATTAVVIVWMATRGCGPADRARVLRAIAEVIRAVWGSR